MSQKWESFGAYVASSRTERGLSVRQVAKHTGLAPSTVMRTEDRPYQTPTPDVFLALVDALDLDLKTAVNLVESYKKLWQRFIADREDDARRAP
ncbi:helix-turn-helix domain-containing protein [Amycolatopsis sp. NPDC059027]|uniref:helix-turn-helix domain-containing protein n=1 Tax=Amycolatopsis sp. NPDC059027 TaxID=3346709 RepID=UPI00366D92AE